MNVQSIIWNYVIKTLCAISALLLFASCVQEGNVIYVNEDEEEDTRPLVVFVCGEDKMGDLTYYDVLYSGIMKAATTHDMLVFLYSLKDDTPDQLKESFESLFTSFPSGFNGHKVLVILGNDNYESALHACEEDLKKNLNMDVLLVESRDETLPVNTMFFSLYGACYQAGRAVGHSMDEVKNIAIVSANQTDDYLTDLRKGFMLGLFDENTMVKADTLFLAADSKGYNMADSAYHISYALDSTYQMVLPLCGGTIQGFLRYNREHPSSFYTIGIDADMQQYASRVPFSLVKHLDQAVQDWIAKWVAGDEIPPHLYYGLESGYTEIVLSDPYKALLESAMQQYEQIAITKENEYNASK